MLYTDESGRILFNASSLPPFNHMAERQEVSCAARRRAQAEGAGGLVSAKNNNAVARKKPPQDTYAVDSG